MHAHSQTHTHTPPNTENLSIDSFAACVKSEACLVAATGSCWVADGTVRPTKDHLISNMKNLFPIKQLVSAGQDISLLAKFKTLQDHTRGGREMAEVVRT